MQLRCAIWLFGLLLGCDTVKSTVPLGVPVADEKAKELEGVWLTPGGEALSVKHIGKNELRAAGVEWTDDGFKLSEFNAFVGEDDDQLYINIVDEDNGNEEPGYNFSRLIVADDDYLLLLAPNAETFDQGIKDGKLSGTSKRNQDRLAVDLDSPAKQLNEFVEPALVGNQFVLDAPLVLRRVQKFEEEDQP